MTDLNIGAAPYKAGDKIMLEVTITDADIANDFITKIMHGPKYAESVGFDIDKSFYWEDRYEKAVRQELLSAIVDEHMKTIDTISDILRHK